MEPVHEQFAGAGEAALTLDIFRPTGPSNETAVLLLHGGGWRAGDRSRMHPYARHLAARGFAAIAVQYRLLDRAPWPAQLEDVIAAVKWARAHAQDLGVRPDRIVAEGFSAGAHLALMAGGEDLGLAAVVAFFPPTQLALDLSDPAATDARMLLGPDAAPEVAEAASPITRVSPAFPPTMLLHGGADWAVSPASSRAMYHRLIAAGVKAELHLFADEHHEFCAVSDMVVPTQDLVADFLRRIVVAPKEHAELALQENPFAKGPEAFAAMAARAR